MKYYFACITAALGFFLNESAIARQATQYLDPPDCSGIEENCYSLGQYGYAPTSPAYSTYFQYAAPAAQANLYYSFKPDSAAKPAASATLSSVARYQSPFVEAQKSAFISGSTTVQAKSCLSSFNKINSAPGAATQCSTLRTPASDVVAPLIPKYEVTESRKDCDVHSVTRIPGSGQYGSDFLENIVAVPDNPKMLFAVSTDLSSSVPVKDQGLYVSRSTDGGKSWQKVAKLNSQFYDAYGEGLRNAITVSNGGKEVVVTTKKGAYQIDVDKSLGDDNTPSITSIGNLGKPAGDAKMNPSGTKMIVSYGYFEGHPEVMSYEKNSKGTWDLSTGAAQIPAFNKKNQILTLRYDDPKKADSFVVGNGQNADHFDATKRTWNPIKGFDTRGGLTDSAIHGMDTESACGLKLATCNGVYIAPSEQLEEVEKVGSSEFVSRTSEKKVKKGEKRDLTQVRAYSVNANPRDCNQIVVTAATGVYTSTDGGGTWKRMRGFPQCVSATRAPIDGTECANVVAGALGHTRVTAKVEGKKDTGYGPADPNLYMNEFKSAHFNPDGSIVVSGTGGTFTSDIFADHCKP